MEHHVQQVWEELPRPQARDCLEILTKILSNILQNPTEAKFRSIKKSSKAFAGKIAVSPSAVLALLCVGFQEGPVEYTFPEDASFDQMHLCLEILQAALLEVADEPDLREEAQGASAAEPQSIPGADKKAPAPPISRRVVSSKAPDADKIADARRLQKEKFRENELNAALEGAPPRQPAAPTTLGEQAPAAAAAASKATSLGLVDQAGGEKRKPAPRTAFDFVRREEATRGKEKATESLADLNKVRAAKFREHRATNPQDSAAAQPRSGDEEQRVPATSADGAKASTAPAAQPAGSWAEWFPEWMGPLTSRGQNKDAASERTVLTPEASDPRTIKF